MAHRYKRFFVGRLTERDIQKLLPALAGYDHNLRPGEDTFFVATNGEEPVDSIVDLTFYRFVREGKGLAYCSLCYLCVNTDDLSPIPSLSCVESHKDRIRLEAYGEPGTGWDFSDFSGDVEDGVLV
ncbi:hypothetical protein [Thermus phage P23-45]|nr:hypothetical protein [Thermus phage P23-45]